LKLRLFAFLNTLLTELAKKEIQNINVLLNSNIAERKVEHIKTIQNAKDLFGEIIGDVIECVNTQEVHKKDYIKQGIIEFIENNYMNDSLSVSVTAEKFGYSTTFLVRLFNNFFGMGVLDYIQKVRIKKACEIILSDNYNMADIAEKVGYTNITTFNRTFKKVMGVTPGIYRNKIKNND
jgi:YesN/AraC family two-component response regulator